MNSLTKTTLHNECGEESIVASHPNAESSLPREWLRVQEACEYSRLSKPLLYRLMNRGLIRNVSLRERGRVRGARLISFDSLRQYLESRATGGAPTSENTPKGSEDTLSAHVGGEIDAN